MAAHLLEGRGHPGRRRPATTIERHERLLALGSVTAGLTHELEQPGRGRAPGPRSTLRERLDGLRTPSSAAWPRPASTAASSRPSPSWPARRSTDRREAPSCRRCRPPTARTSWPTGSTTTASRTAGTWRPRWWPRGSTSTAPAAGRDAGRRRRARVGLLALVCALESDALLERDHRGRRPHHRRCWRRPSSTRRWTGPRCRPCDVHEGLDATLTMLGHKLGAASRSSATTT